ncbi:hypothetical protein EDB19DRAFT_1895054 [Suillus lakei]|nr:hypothetical protein EDB19DRAFT_1895054 [Suillus lakei]
MLDRLEDDPYLYWQKINHYCPFQDEGEWELGKFLVENLTQTQMIKFLKLKWPSFTMKDQLLNWMDSLPCFTEWKVSKIEFSGYKTVYPIELIWHDALEVVKQLFGDPIFANHMTYAPHIDYLPVGATQVPIILGSDKTHVTRITGGLEMHPVFITIGNIDSEFHMHPDYQSILQAQLWHKCMDLILANLKAMALYGCFMPDPNRHIHFVFTPLIAHFQKAAKAVGLSGVHMPYWHDWLYACPSIFLAGEILHMCFKFFADHPLKWIKEVIGAHELDNCFIIQHKQVGMHHFAKGVSHVKQMMGREYREIQCTIVASIAGATSPQFIHSICAIMDFIYLTQNPVHSPATLQSMEQALSEIFLFPNLSYYKVSRADTTEHLLITHCKNPFSWMAHQSKDFTEQCMWLLNCQESMEIFNLVSLVNTMHAEEEVAITNPTLSWVSCVLPDEVKLVRGPQPVCNHFLKGILSGDTQTAFQVNVTPDYRSLLLAEICTTYKLSNFNCALADFIVQSSSSSGKHVQWDPRYGCYQAWNKFRLQFHSAFQRHIIMPSRVVQAYPPSDTFPFGNCDTVLIDAMGINGKMTSYVAQVQLVFQLVVRQGSILKLPSYLSNMLLYVEFFRFTSSPNHNPKVTMWTVKRMYMQDQNGNCLREGAIVQLTGCNTCG